MQLQSNMQMAECWEHVHSAMYMPPEQTGRCATVLSTLLGENVSVTIHAQIIKGQGH